MKSLPVFFSFLLLTAFISCKQKAVDYIRDPNVIYGNESCDDHVLKEPYVLYQGDPTGNAIMVQTTSYIKDFGTVKIRWGTDGNYGPYHDMNPHKFNMDGGCQDYYIWEYSWGHGTFTPDTKINYKVNVHLSHKDYYFENWFYTSAVGLNDFSFYAYGDTRDGGDNYASVMNAMAVDMDQDYGRRYRLVIHTGDVVYNGAWRRYSPWDQTWNTHFFGRGCNNNGGDRGKALWILAHTPVMTCLGNHDFWWDGHDLNNTTRYYCSNWPYWMYTYSSGITLDQACNTDFDQTYDEDDAYYAFDYGIVHFISLSTYPTLGAPDQSASLNVGLPQYTWLENDLQQNTKPWTIVFCHIPFYDGGGAHNLPAIASCEPLFQEYGVDAVLQGHEHAYIRINVDKGTGNEIPYITLGCGGVEPETNAHNLADCYAEKLHFARFDVTNTDSLHVLVTEKHLNIPGNIDNFYIKNRPKKP